MNAYELADYVADNGYIGTKTTHKVAIMLRQQADRIAELEKECLDWEKAFIKAIQESHVIK